MAWIPCEDKLFSNPMTARLAAKMGWTINAAGGTILRLRCWCIEFAPDGDLRSFAPGEIAGGLGEPPADGERIVTALIEGQWLETTPYFRVSAWWQIAGLFLKGRFRREPAVWKRIERMYCSGSENENSASEATETAETGETDSAHEQLMSDSRAVQGPLAPILSQLIPSYLSKADQNPPHHLPHHLQVSDEQGFDAKNSGSDQRFAYSRLIQEIFEYAGSRRFSFADEQQLRRLAATHGREVIEACQHLHGGIVNVPAYLRTVLEGSDRGNIMWQRVARILNKQEAEKRRKEGTTGEPPGGQAVVVECREI